MTEPQAVTRLDRRKARTRAALIAAARELLATNDAADVNIKEITEAADVGFGSFYNHFETKAELFDAALAEVAEEYGALFDAITADLEDPAEVFAAPLRMTARLPKTHPQIAHIISRTGFAFITAPNGLAPRALRDLMRGRDEGRFSFGDPTIALACVAGAMLAVLHLASLNPKPSVIDRNADELAINMLRMLGLDAEDAHEVVGRKLPKAS
jgi:AcrR family transcriptional regulator